jgi:DNA replication protein DnaC
MFAEIDYLDKRKADKLVDTVTNIRHKCAILIMMDCGLRVTECVTLQLKNFDFKNRSISVRSLKKRGEEVWRKIPISDRLYECLAEYLKNFKEKNPDTYLFGKSDGKPITRKAMNRVCTKLRIKNPEFGNLHPHTLRHTCATQLLASGAQLHEIREILGHTKYDTTLIYTHIPQEVLKSRIDKMTETKLSLWQKIKNYIFPKNRSTLINLTNEANQFIVGRTDELIRVTELLNKNCNVILLGGIGSGKTHLMHHITSNKKILRFDDFSDLKKTLTQCLLFLYKNDKEHVFNLLYPDYDLAKAEQHLQKDSIINLCREVKKITSKHEYVLYIDNCDKITPKGIKALEELKDHFVIFTTARQIPVNKSSFLWNFEIIQMENLKRPQTLELIQKLAYDLDVDDWDTFRNHIWEQSSGNPRVTFEMVERLRKEVVLSTESIRNIRHFGSLREYDMSFTVILGLASLAILRYLSGEVGNDSLRFIGGCAMIALIFSRYVFNFTKRKFL